MFLDRTDRSKVSLWWWTVDHKLMGLITLLIIGGVMVLMSAGSPVAIKKGLNEYHFFGETNNLSLYLNSINDYYFNSKNFYPKKVLSFDTLF